MTRILGWLLASFAFIGLCWLYPPVRVVRLEDTRRQQANAAFDAKRFAREFWKEQLLPATKEATDAAHLVRALKQNGPAARETFGRTVGLGGTTFFLVKGSGQIKEVADEAVRVVLEDGGAEVLLHTDLLFGNTVRDTTGMIDVSRFGNSQDFNAISTELNQIVETEVIPKLLEGAASGKHLQFAGCIELDEGADVNQLVVVPISIEWK